MTKVFNVTWINDLDHLRAFIAKSVNSEHHFILSSKSQEK